MQVARLRTLAVVLLAILIASALVVPAASAQSGANARLVVLTPTLNVRSGPGLNYGVIDALRQGADVAITGSSGAGGWWQVTLPSGRQGWVSGSTALVQVQGATANVPVVAAPAQAAQTVPAAAGAQPASGGTIVFQVASGGPIYAVNANGTGLRQLTSGIDPALSPDGRTVAFTRWDSSTTGTPGSLWVINTDGSGERAITKDLRQPKSPTWSPDGQRISVNIQQGGQLDPKRSCEGLPPPDAYDIDSSKGPDGFWHACYTLPPDPFWILTVVNVADGSFANLPSEAHAFTPSWNPTNDWQVIYHGSQGLQSMDVKRNANWQLTSDPNDHSPAFAPDGKKLAIAYHQGDHWEVYTLNPDGSGRTRLTGSGPTGPNNTAPTWSPDGKQIAFLSDRSGKWEFWVMNADGSNQRLLFPASALAELNLNYAGVDERMISWR
jgi:dipeptidyl aminopeptidase/acylaminoacyl peptidase